MKKFIFVYITAPSKKEAKKIAEYLLKKRLIACANIFPIDSFYCWKNKIKEDKEVVLIIKTIGKNFEKIKKEVERIHSYSVPFVAKISATINKKYFNWFKKQIK